MAARKDLFNELPQEIRLQIFRLATIKPSQTEDTRAEYRPFDPVAMSDRDWSSSSQMALTVKAAIILVCKEWKFIATEMLYECIRIRHGSHNLLTALESTRYSNPHVASGSSPDFEFDYGRWVRRIEISTEILDFDPFNPYLLFRILQCCPFVQSVVRSCDNLGSGGTILGSVRLPPCTNFPTFPSIKRIDWWLMGVALRRSGFLEELVAHSPSLNYLTLSGGGNSHFSITAGVDPFRGRSEPFDSLTTLRLETEDAKVISIGPTPLLPNLSHLILGGVYFAEAGQFLSTYGEQIRVVEFVVIHTLVPRNHTIGPLVLPDVLKACPNLQELNVHPSNILLADAKSRAPIHLKSLTSIRVQLDYTTSSTASDFGLFIRHYLICPALERIILCGGTRQVWEESASLPILKKYISETRSISLEYQES